MIDDEDKVGADWLAGWEAGWRSALEALVDAAGMLANEGRQTPKSAHSAPIRNRLSPPG